jgi:preprotein translocase subunit SecE
VLQVQVLPGLPVSTLKGANAKTMAENSEQTGFIEKAKTFFREAIAELKKVTWPTFKDVRGSSLVVVGFVLIFTAIVTLVDMALRWGIHKLIQ